MDEIDEKLLNMIKGNARMTYQEMGNALGMTRMAAKKRVKKLEEAGIIRGYNTTIYREDEVTMMIDITTTPESFEKVLEYVSTRTAFVRQIFRTTKENHIHIVAASTDIRDLKYLLKMIQKSCGEEIEHFSCHAVTEIIKDVYGGVRYDKEQRKIRTNQKDI